MVVQWTSNSGFNCILVIILHHSLRDLFIISPVDNNFKQFFKQSQPVLDH